MEYYMSHDGRLYSGDLQPGDRVAAAQEVARLVSARLITARCEEINRIKEAKSAVMAFGGHRYDTDVKGRLNILGKLSEIERSAGGIRTITWLTHDNAMVVLSAAAFTALAEAIPAHEEACVFTAFRHKMAVSALGAPEAIAACDITEGWPA